MFALVDCNNFYASCERVFNPKLRQKPLIILSNNDGCVIARSNEAKKLGIPMGAPLFKCQHIVKKHKIIVLSSNYTLYGDMSDRVMYILKYYFPDIEIYSIDEAFLRLDNMALNDNVENFLQNIRNIILRWTGIPVSIGVAQTKTLAKVANHYAKKHIDNGVFYLSKSTENKVLANLDITDIWGVGHRLGRRLQAMGYITALDLKMANAKIIRSQFSVNLERTIRELNGIACFDLESIVPKQSIMSSRSFGKKVTEFNEVSAALAHYAAIACEKMRAQNSLTDRITVFVRTSPHAEPASKRYENCISLGLDAPTADTGQIIQLAIQGLSKIFKVGYEYQKTGIFLQNLTPDAEQHYSLFEIATINRTQLMHTLDFINEKMGASTVFYAVEGIQKNWKLKANKRTPRYTTNWDELLTVGG